MTTALLIGFHYYHTPQWSPLLSTAPDLAGMMEWCKNWADHTVVVCDTEVISAADLRAYLTSFTLLSRRLLIYYSGHGILHHWILPSGEKIATNEIQDIVCSWLDPHSEVVWLIDCCSPTNFKLPFQLSNNKWELQHADDISYLTNPWLVIISANGSEKSVATNKGSLFTGSWLTYLNSTPARSTNLRQLKGSITSTIYCHHKSSYQTVSIYSSHLIDPVLWSWIGKVKTSLDEVVSDPSQSLLVVRKRPPHKVLKTPRLHQSTAISEWHRKSSYTALVKKINLLRKSNDVVAVSQRLTSRVMSAVDDLVQQRLYDDKIVYTEHTKYQRTTAWADTNFVCKLILNFLADVATDNPSSRAKRYNILTYTDSSIHFSVYYQGIIAHISIFPQINAVSVNNIRHFDKTVQLHPWFIGMYQSKIVSDIIILLFHHYHNTPSYTSSWSDLSNQLSTISESDSKDISGEHLTDYISLILLMSLTLQLPRGSNDLNNLPNDSLIYEKTKFTIDSSTITTSVTPSSSESSGVKKYKIPHQLAQVYQVLLQALTR